MNETIEGIVREIRDENPPKYYPAEYGGGEVEQPMRRLADRIEKAHRREIEIGAEAARICGEIGEAIGRGCNAVEEGCAS